MTQPGSPAPRRARGFTLIELLVVISIIVLLISVLLPSLAGARDAARDTQCSSNLHQFGVVATAYASDYKGYCMDSTRSSAVALGSKSGHPGWTYSVYYDYLLEAFNGNFGVMDCPKQQSLRPGYGGGQPIDPYPWRNIWPGYGISFHTQLNGLAAAPLWRVDNVKAPMRKVYFADSGWAYHYYSPTFAQGDGWSPIIRGEAEPDWGGGRTLSARHKSSRVPDYTYQGLVNSGGSFISYFDGHVNFLEWNKGMTVIYWQGTAWNTYWDLAAN